ncbi:radical SAM/SPASM domain-containing protein [Methanocella conradii]|uniref:radical SAM/SPASM domain-containing protein n=1 Tax=Methanocella conradii TaxID=1175444 RepID=UPI0020C631A9|nr:radical SAM protein [Methanocella conradii]
MRLRILRVRLRVVRLRLRLRRRRRRLHMIKTRIDNTRLHLREEADGTGMLIINASNILYLDKIGMDYVRHYIRYSRKKPLIGSVRDNVVWRMMLKYKVKKKQAEADYDRLQSIIWGVTQGNACPFTCFDVKIKEPQYGLMKSPIRIDLALTYRCNNNCSHCYAGGPRQTKELSTEEWKKIIKKAVDFEVPNIVLTGGEPLLRDDLEELIAYAEGLDVVTGLITNGRLLTKERVASLKRAGLDYVQITIESPDPAIHDKMCGAASFEETVAGIKNCVGELYTTTNTTITRQNYMTVGELVPFLHGLGVRKFGLNAVIRAGKGTETDGLTPEELKELLPDIINKANALGMEFIWYTPTKYHKLNPVEMGLGIKSCSAARLTLAVEPDGSVLPCQSYFKPLGNALNDDFRAMWDSELARYLRSHSFAPERCRSCIQFPMCGGGCPLDLACGF